MCNTSPLLMHRCAGTSTEAIKTSEEFRSLLKAWSDGQLERAAMGRDLEVGLFGWWAGWRELLGCCGWGCDGVGRWAGKGHMDGSLLLRAN